MPWITLDDSHLTEVEYAMGTRLSNVLDANDAATIQTTVLDIHAQPLTTVMVLRRPTERILLVIRNDRSTVVATDDIYATRWRDGVA